MNEKALIMDRDAVNRALTRISHEITEKNHGIEKLMVVGVRRRGVSLARILCEKMKEIEGKAPAYGELDITFYRDDLTLLSDHPEVKNTCPKLEVNDRCVVLVDDVIFTGRTVRAAIDCLMDMGRPRRIQLAVLIDRGHRELPIRPDYVGKNVPTSLNEVIQVSTDDFDGEQSVRLFEK